MNTLKSIGKQKMQRQYEIDKTIHDFPTPFPEFTDPTRAGLCQPSPIAWLRSKSSVSLLTDVIFAVSI